MYRACVSARRPIQRSARRPICSVFGTPFVLSSVPYRSRRTFYPYPAQAPTMAGMQWLRRNPFYFAAPWAVWAYSRILPESDVIIHWWVSFHISDLFLGVLLLRIKYCMAEHACANVPEIAPPPQLPPYVIRTIGGRGRVGGWARRSTHASNYNKYLLRDHARY